MLWHRVSLADTVRRAMRSSQPPSTKPRVGNITLAGLRAFVAVVEARSFSEGARSLGLTQPSVSVQVAALEQACGLLLCRRKPEFELTEPGRALFVKARRVISGVEDLEAAVAGAQVAAGRLCVGVSVPHVAMALLASFRQAHPDVGVELTMGNTASLLGELSRCKVDVGIMTLIEPDPAFECRLLCRPRLMACMPVGDAWARRKSVPVDDLVGRALVMREPGSQTRALLESLLARAGLSPVSALEMGSREAMREAVASGLGIGVLFDNEHGHDTRLALVPLQGVPSTPAVYAVALPESLGLPAVRRWMDHVRSTAPRASQAAERRGVHRTVT